MREQARLAILPSLMRPVSTIGARPGRALLLLALAVLAAGLLGACGGGGANSTASSVTSEASNSAAAPTTSTASAATTSTAATTSATTTPTLNGFASILRAAKSGVDVCPSILPPAFVAATLGPAARVTSVAQVSGSPDVICSYSAAGQNGVVTLRMTNRADGKAVCAHGAAVTGRSPGATSNAGIGTNSYSGADNGRRLTGTLFGPYCVEIHTPPAVALSAVRSVLLRVGIYGLQSNPGGL